MQPKDKHVLSPTVPKRSLHRLFMLWLAPFVVALILEIINRPIANSTTDSTLTTYVNVISVLAVIWLFIGWVPIVLAASNSKKARQ